MERSARFSPCRRYRYALWRAWDITRLPQGDGRQVVFVGLNPSTADETIDDPTIRRCIAFAQAWGFAALCVTNLFACRAADPAEMMRADDPIGPENDEWLLGEGARSALVVAAWGVFGAHRGRDEAVRAMLPGLHCLRLTKHGHPAHPL